MLFGLKNEPTILSRVVVAVFKQFIRKFLEVYLDDWTIFNLLKDHVEMLLLMLEKCRQFQILERSTFYAHHLESCWVT